MKIEIEVPDGFIAGKLVFLEARLEGRLEGASLNVVDVSTERAIKEEKPDAARSQAGCRIPWEAN